MREDLPLFAALRLLELEHLAGFEPIPAPFLAAPRVIDAHFSHRFSVPIENCTDQAGAGGARRRAMRARICPNIRRDTATSANWKVM